MPPITITLVLTVITCLTSIAAFNDSSLFQKWMHYPYAENKYKEYYRMLSSGFIHASWVHLFVNMMAFYSFGSFVESEFKSIFGANFGSLAYLTLYLTAIVFADLPTLQKYKDSPHYTAVGASGGVCAIAFASILFNPWGEVELFFAIPIRSIVFGVLFLIYSQWASRNQINNPNDNIGHDAHFYGAIYGMLFTVALKPSIYNDFVDLIVHQSPWW